MDAGDLTEFLSDFAFLDVQTSIICTVLCLAWIYMLIRKPSGLPPGPSWRAPILGHLREFKGQELSQILDKYRKRYGGVYSLYLGRKLVVIVNGLDAIREAFVSKSDEFPYIPNTALLKANSECHDFCETKSNSWKELKTLTTAPIESFGFDELSLESIIREEIALLHDDLEAYHTITFNPRHLLTTSIFNANCSILFGTRYSHNDPEFQHVFRLTERCCSAGSSTGLLNFLPFLRHLPGDFFRFREFQGLLKELNGYYEEHINKMKWSYSKQPTSAVLKTTQHISDDIMKVLIGSVLCTGSEMTVDTLCCGIRNLIKYPDIQERIYSEINDYIGERRQPALADREHLMYTRAFIMETQRLAKLSTLSLPHTVDHDTTLQGHRIPKGTILFPDLHSVMSDPELWNDPHRFWPERFFSKTGQLLEPERIIPFFTGQKTSIGEQLASVELFLVLSSLVHSLQFYSPDNEELLGEDSVSGPRRKSFNVKVRKRNGHWRGINQKC